MIRTIRAFFETRLAEVGANDDSALEHQLRLTTAALLFEVCRADFETDSRELDTIARLSREVFDLSEQETSTLMELAEIEAKDATSLHGYTTLLNRHLDVEQKTYIIELMWRVAFADEVLEKHEQHLMRKVANLLYVPHGDYIAAKQRARSDAD